MAAYDMALFYIVQGIIVPGFTQHVKKVKGFDKLFNRVVKYLLTSEGSDPFDKNYGTGLVDMLGSTGNDQDYVSEVIEDCIDRARSYFRDKEAAAVIAGTPLPDEEVLGEIQFASFELIVDTLHIYVSISNKLGTTKVAHLTAS
jgi:hypothetical protein